MLQYNYEQLESNLTYSLLAAAIVNLNEYAASGNLIISDAGEPEAGDKAFSDSYSRFKECLRCNIGLDENLQSAGLKGLLGGVDIVSFRVYNYISDAGGWHITECGVNGGQPYTLRYPDNMEVYVNANDGMVNIAETSVYAEISFTLEGFGTYSLTRLVAVTD